MCSGERPMGAAKGTQRNTEALCHPPPPPEAETVWCGPRRWPRTSAGCTAVCLELNNSPDCLWIASDDTDCFIECLLFARCAYERG